MAVMVQPIIGKLSGGGTDYEQLINYTMLYDSGDECSEVSGGWETLKGTVTKNKNNIALGVNSSTASIVYTTNTIPYTQYNKMYSYGNASADNKAFLACARTTTDTPIFEYAPTGNGLVEVDLSEALDTYMASIGCAVNNSYVIYDVFITKADDFTTLCKKAGVTAPNTLVELIADTEALTAIFNSEEAIKFMIRQCTGDFMVAVLNDETAVGLLKESPYLNKVIANVHWAKFMMMLPTAQSLLNYAMFYDEGDECETASGGWNGYDSGGKPKAYKQDNYLEINSSAGVIGAAYFVTSSEINSSNFNNMCVIYSRSVITNTLAFGTASNNSSVYATFAAGQLNNIHTPTKAVTRELAIGELSDKTGKYLFLSGDNTGYFHTIFLTKPDNFTEWASIAGITATDLDALLVDSTAMATLMANQSAIDYLAGCTGDLMVAICNSEVAMSALLDNIAYDTLWKHPVWRKFMLMIPTSLEALKSAPTTASVPTMTSDNNPSGIVTYSRQYSNQFGYKAFDKSTTTNWSPHSSSTADEWIAYEFTEKIRPFLFEINNYTNGNIANIKNCRIEAYNEETDTWEKLISTILEQGSQTQLFKFMPTRMYKKFRLYVVDTYGTGNGIGLFEFNIYGKVVAE